MKCLSLAVAGALALFAFLVVVYIRHIEARADPLTSRFKAGDVVQTVSSPETDHVVDTRQDGSFISKAFEGKPAYLVRYPSGRFVWMAEGELKFPATKN